MKNGCLQTGIALLVIAAFPAIKAVPSIVSGTVGGPCLNGVFACVATLIFGVSGLACVINASLPPPD